MYTIKKEIIGVYERNKKKEKARPFIKINHSLIYFSHADN